VYLSTSRLIVIGATIAVTVGIAPNAPAAARLACASCVIVDENGTVLFSRAALEPRANASTTKIVTALVVRDRAELDEVVTVSETAAATGGGGLDLSSRDRYEVESLLYALLMTSSNEAAVALAEHVAGSEPRFVALMNRTAAALGARATHFVTAHGLDMPSHYSCARDLALFGLELLRDPVLAEIVDTTTTTIPGPAGRVVLENRNVLLEGYKGASGIKTGYTALAGDVLVASARRGSRAVVAVTMGATSDEVAAVEATALLDRGWMLLARTVIFPADRALATLVYDPSGATEVVAGEPIRGPWPLEDIAISFEPAAGITPPLAAGDEVGRVTVRHDGRIVAEAPALARDPIPAADGTTWGETLLTGLLRALGSLAEEIA